MKCLSPLVEITFAEFVVGKVAQNQMAARLICVFRIVGQAVAVVVVVVVYAMFSFN